MAVLCDFLEETGWSTRDGEEGLIRKERELSEVYRSIWEDGNYKGVDDATQRTVQLRIGRTVSAR